MIDTNALKAAWVSKGLNQSDVAKMLGISEKTMSQKMKIGVFGSDEMEIMIDSLEISNPAAIFFAKIVT